MSSEEPSSWDQTVEFKACAYLQYKEEDAVNQFGSIQKFHEELDNIFSEIGIPFDEVVVPMAPGTDMPPQSDLLRTLPMIPIDNFKYIVEKGYLGGDLWIPTMQIMFANYGMLGDTPDPIFEYLVDKLIETGRQEELNNFRIPLTGMNEILAEQGLLPAGETTIIGFIDACFNKDEFYQRVRQKLVNACGNNDSQKSSPYDVDFSPFMGSPFCLNIKKRPILDEFYQDYNIGLFDRMFILLTTPNRDINQQLEGFDRFWDEMRKACQQLDEIVTKHGIDYKVDSFGGEKVSVFNYFVMTSPFKFKLMVDNGHVKESWWRPILVEMVDYIESLGDPEDQKEDDDGMMPDVHINPMVELLVDKLIEKGRKDELQDISTEGAKYLDDCIRQKMVG